MSAAVERIAERAVDVAAARLVAELGPRLPGVAVTREGGDVVLTGRGLAMRATDDPVLRWPAGALR